MAIFATVDCLTNSGSINDYYINSNEVYVTCYNTLIRAQTAGHVTRIAYGTGSAVSGAAGTGVDYWDTGNASGGNSFSVWRFHSSSFRPFDFYLFLTYASTGNLLGTIPSQSLARNTPSALFSPVVFQIATSVNPTTSASVNPWNGTLNNNGTDTFNTSDSLWTSGAASHILNVHPSDNFGGAFPNSNLVGYLAVSLNTTPRMRFNFYVAAGGVGDGILMAYKTSAINTTWVWNFGGVYTPRLELSSSIKMPLVYCSNDECSSDFATVISNIPWPSGSSGLGLPDNRVANPFLADVEWWAKPGNLPMNSFLGTQPAQELSYPQLCINGNFGLGFMGTFDSPLFKIVAGIPTDVLVNQENNVVFGSSTTTAVLKLVAPWSSSVGGIPGTHQFRTGSSF